MIRWIFFDVGNVLFNDDPQTYHIYRRYHATAERRRPGFTFAEFLREREREVARGNRWPTQSVLLRYLSAGEFDAVQHEVSDELRGMYDSVNLPMPGGSELIQALAPRYQLGVIANQVVECRSSLARRGLLDHFGVVAISEELGLHKPDPALFRWALERAGVRPDQAIMVGDRHDNDVVPAAGLGMHSIWVRWRSWRGKGWSPDHAAAHAFLASHDREPFYGRVTCERTCACATVEHLDAVLPAIERLAREAERST